MNTSTHASSSSTPLDGQVAVVLGGNGGIGAAAARHLAAAGATIALVTHRHDASADEVLQVLPGNGHKIFLADLTDSASLTRLAAAVAAEWQRADILVNAAGKTYAVPHADLDGLSDAMIDEIFAINYRGAFAAVRAFAPLLREGDGGLVVNVSSIAASTAVGSNIAYCSAKAALDTMTRALGRALAPQIRVLGVSPGVVDTGFVPGRSADFNQQVGARTPLGRIGSPDDVAAAIEACATRLRFSTGVTIVVDGGRQL
ncbi:short-chain dehydrogenase [Burkholderia sp. SRS-W-2-2016]|uniref:SDR family NAD(P)-dependent oxidoreductase n=1 Tax=Burkholderia sp. SRS-W-2-2016 TaxID=1926878 RepID=UPI00094B5669|nr:SDR family oxidoreductase [Burkholderia sp. SRS-W-2-2016]OLL32302.1 short-chain dehydrogenase [Burkholderia sp. SRS-W-2-2016]